MANTRLNTPGELGDSLRSLSKSMLSLARKMDAEDKYWRSELARGEHALTLKTRMDNMFEGVNAELRRLGQELGNESTAPLLSTLFKTQWRAGVNNSLRYFKTGASNSLAFTSSGAAQGLVLIDYLDVGPNYDIFSGLVLNDVIEISNCSDPDHNGLKSVRWDAKAKGNSGSDYGLTQGDFSGSGSDWTGGTDWTVNTGAGIYTYAAASPTTLTQALSGMTTTGLYVVQFDVAKTGAGEGTLRCSIGGDYYWEKTYTTGTEASTSYQIVTNSPSTTPTLTFTATRSAGAFSVTIDNVYVYGYQGLMVSEAFPSEETGLNTIITLTQTAA